MTTSPTPVAFGVTSMTAPLQRVLVRHPATEGDWAGAGWRVPDPAGLARQHEAFCALLASLGAEVEVAPALDGLLDAVYVHDPLLVTGAGAIPLRMRKPARAQEPAHAREDDMAHDRGPGAVLHLQSFLSAITGELCVVFEPLAPVRLLEDLRERGMDWIAIDADDYEAMRCNVLAAARPASPRRCGAAERRGPLGNRSIWETIARGGLERALFPWGSELEPGGEHRCTV